MHRYTYFNHKNFVKSDTTIKSGCMGKAKKKFFLWRLIERLIKKVPFRTGNRHD